MRYAKPRLAIIAHAVVPYRLAVFSALSSFYDVRVFFLAARDSNRIWEPELERVQFQYEFLPGIAGYVQALDWGVYVNTRVESRLAQFDPQGLLLMAYDGPSFIRAIIFGRRHNVPLTLWFGSHSMSSRATHGPVAWVRRLLVRRFDTFVTYGVLASAYLRDMGVAEENIVTSTNTVDVERLAEEVDRLGPEARGEHLAPVRFLFVGQLIPRKGLDVLFDAFELMQPTDCSLTVVGHGPLEDWVRSRAAASKGNVHYLGPSRGVSELAAVMVEADVLVVPSWREVWGLVINEGLAAGLYVIATRQAGATWDLLLAGPAGVGEVVEAGDSRGLAEAMGRAQGAVTGGGIDRESIAAWGR